MKCKPKKDQKPADKPKLKKATLRELTDEQLKSVSGGRARPIRKAR